MSKYKKINGGGFDPLAGDNHAQEADSQIFSAGVSGLVDARVVAKPTALADIWADVKQPRRAIPASIRGDWDGDPAKVQKLLIYWGKVAVSLADFDPTDIVNGRGDGVDVEAMPAIASQYVELCRLAQDIKRVGLSNPISVIKTAGGYLIESGERRYLAYHLLNLIDGDKWDKVPAITSSGENFVWKQASENTARRALNPIGMARQLALLIMESRRGVDGQDYNEYGELVLAGGCDRAFYAQVANGNIHRIPKGFAERIQMAMGLSDKQLSRYRSLLRLTDDEKVNDALWTRADIEDWAEGALRMIADTSPIGEVRAVISREAWGIEDLRALVEKKPASAPPAPNYPDYQQGRARSGLDGSPGGYSVPEREVSPQRWDDRPTQPAQAVQQRFETIETGFDDGDLIIVKLGAQFEQHTLKPMMNEVKDHEVCKFVEAFRRVEVVRVVEHVTGQFARIWRHSRPGEIDEFAVVALSRLMAFSDAQEVQVSSPPAMPADVGRVRGVSVVEEDERPTLNGRQINDPDGWVYGMQAEVIAKAGALDDADYQPLDSAIPKGTVVQYVELHLVDNLTYQGAQSRQALVKWGATKVFVSFDLLKKLTTDNVVSAPSVEDEDVYFLLDNASETGAKFKALRNLVLALDDQRLHALMTDVALMTNVKARTLKQQGKFREALLAVYQGVDKLLADLVGVVGDTFQTWENDSHD